MLVYIYDNSFEGLLTALFDSYARRESPDAVIASGRPLPMFTETVHEAAISTENAARVWKGVQRRAGKQVCNMLTCLWLSEEEGADCLIFRYLRKIFDSPEGVFLNFADDDILDAKKLAQKVMQERHRLIQFVRFQKAADGTYFAPVAPQYNSLPLAADHFRDRFSDQKWIIYDTKRHYGYAYDLKEMREIFIDADQDLQDGKLPERMSDTQDVLFQEMWRGYYKALTITKRINHKLQRRCMPVRYRKYMTEHQ